MYRYDKLIIVTGSVARSPLDLNGIENASVFRNADEAFRIAKRIRHKEVLLVGTGPISLELLETLTHYRRGGAYHTARQTQLPL